MKKNHKPIKIPKLKQRNPHAIDAKSRKAGPMPDKRETKRSAQKNAIELMAELEDALKSLEEMTDTLENKLTSLEKEDKIKS